MENYLYTVTITPKKKGEADTATFNVAAKDIADAANKVMKIPDIDYMYNPDICDITFSCKGLIF